MIATACIHPVNFTPADARLRNNGPAGRPQRWPTEQAPPRALPGMGASYRSQVPFLCGFVTCRQNKCHVTAAVYLYSFQVNFQNCLLRNSTKDAVFCPSLEILAAMTQTCTQMPWLLLQQKPFYMIGFEWRRGFKERERSFKLLSQPDCWPDSSPNDVTRGWAFLASDKPGAGARGQSAVPPSPASLWDASSSGSRRLWAPAAGTLTKLHIWGMFHTGKWARHSEGEATTLACKGLIQSLQKRSSQERKTTRLQPLSLSTISLHSPETAPRAAIRQPQGIVNSPWHWSKGSKSRGLRWSDRHYCFDKTKSLSARHKLSVQSQGAGRGLLCDKKGSTPPQRMAWGIPWSSRVPADNETSVCTLPKAMPEIHRSLYFSVITATFFLSEKSNRFIESICLLRQPYPSGLCFTISRWLWNLFKQNAVF